MTSEAMGIAMGEALKTAWDLRARPAEIQPLTLLSSRPAGTGIVVVVGRPGGIGHLEPAVGDAHKPVFTGQIQVSIRADHR